MKVNTILKAGTLAFDIFNHKSTQALGGLVRNGIKRRRGVLGGVLGAPPASGNGAEKIQTNESETRAEPSFLDRLLAPPVMPEQRLPQRPFPGSHGHRGGPYHAPYGGGTPGVYRGPHTNRGLAHQQTLPSQHIKKALQYVTPENMQKAMQWHGIIKSFISKD